MRDMGQWAAATAGAKIEFVPGQGDDPASVENIDARIYRGDGVCHYATFMTTDEIARVLTRWNASGQFGGGRYFWCSDLVIVPSPGVPTMVAAVDELIRSGDIDAVLSKVQDTGDHPEGRAGVEIAPAGARTPCKRDRPGVGPTGDDRLPAGCEPDAV